MPASAVPVAQASSIGRCIAAKSGIAIAAVLTIAAASLLAIGRTLICRCGHVALWHGEVQSDQNSQQLTDWYSFTHVVHGLIFYAAASTALRRWPLSAKLVMAVVLEAAWEIAENTPMMIDRYRATTLALGYTGDSVLNSLADIGCMMFGFWLASRLPVVLSVAIVLTLEVGLALVIRDNLTLNLIALIAPVEAISAWQAGA
jgi:hypothetical protein